MTAELLVCGMLGSQRGYEGDVGLDLCTSETTVIYPGGIKRVHLSAKVAIPSGFWGLLIARSSTNAQGILILPGVIDSGYRGNLYALCVNLSDIIIRWSVGARVCQLILIPAALEIVVKRVDELPSSDRGVNSFGSTGE
jgi:dUTP pyrophosphatase